MGLRPTVLQNLLVISRKNLGKQGWPVLKTIFMALQYCLSSFIQSRIWFPVMLCHPYHSVLHQKLTQFRRGQRRVCLHCWWRQGSLPSHPCQPGRNKPWHSPALPPQGYNWIQIVPGITRPSLSQLKHCYTTQHYSNCSVDMLKHTRGEEKNGEEAHEQVLQDLSFDKFPKWHKWAGIEILNYNEA